MAPRNTYTGGPSDGYDSDASDASSMSARTDTSDFNDVSDASDLSYVPDEVMRNNPQLARNVRAFRNKRRGLNNTLGKVALNNAEDHSGRNQQKKQIKAAGNDLEAQEHMLTHAFQATILARANASNTQDKIYSLGQQINAAGNAIKGRNVQSRRAKDLLSLDKRMLQQQVEAAKNGGMPPPPPPTGRSGPPGPPQIPAGPPGPPQMNAPQPQPPMGRSGPPGPPQMNAPPPMGAPPQMNAPPPMGAPPNAPPNAPTGPRHSAPPQGPNQGGVPYPTAQNVQGHNLAGRPPIPQPPFGHSPAPAQGAPPTGPAGRRGRVGHGGWRGGRGGAAFNGGPPRALTSNAPVQPPFGMRARFPAEPVTQLPNPAPNMAPPPSATSAKMPRKSALRKQESSAHVNTTASSSTAPPPHPPSHPHIAPSPSPPPEGQGLFRPLVPASPLPPSTFAGGPRKPTRRQRRPKGFSEEAFQ